MAKRALLASVAAVAFPAPTPLQAAARSAAASPAAAQSTAVTPAPPMDGSMTAAAAKAAECFACHGPDGNRVVPALPRRAGRSGVCIAGQWRLFRSGVRPSPVTGPMARTLSKQDLDHLAVFVASHVQGLR